MIDMKTVKYADMVEMGKSTNDKKLLKQIIDKINYDIFIEEMAEFLDWNVYNKLRYDVSILEKKLREIENNATAL